MRFESDYADLLTSFNSNGVRYLVVGAYAVGYHGDARATLDFDVWIEANSQNAVRVYRALASFGAPLEKIDVEEFAKPDLVFQIGVYPLRIDVITEVDGVTFAEAWEQRSIGSILGVEATIIGRRALIANKKAAGRDKDLIDVRRLERGTT